MPARLMGNCLPIEHMSVVKRSALEHPDRMQQQHTLEATALDWGVLVSYRLVCAFCSLITLFIRRDAYEDEDRTDKWDGGSFQRLRGGLVYLQRRII